MQAKIEKHLERFGVSGPGRDWIMRALNPAGEHKSPGLPDQSAVSVLRPDYRIQRTIGPPPGATTWDCYIWSPPGDVNALYWASAPSPADFTTGIKPAGSEVGVVRLQPSVESPLSVTAPIFFTVVAGATTVAAVTSLPTVDASCFRHQFKSLTVTLVAPAVADQGQIYAAQFSPLLRDGGLFLPNYVNYPSSIGAGSGFFGVASHCTLPTNEVDLCAMAPGFYMDAAREGAYVPCHLAGPSQPFAQTNCASSLAAAPTGMYLPNAPILPYQVGGVFVGTSRTQTIASATPWPFACAAGFSSALGDALDPAFMPLQMDTGYDNMSVPVVICRGLAGSTTGFGASLQVKVIAGLEIVPNPTAANRVYTEPAAPYEPRALEAYYAMCMELKQAYPASYNSLEDILNAIGSVASKVWSIFEPSVSQVIPGLVHAGAGALMRSMGGLTGARRGEPRGSAVRAAPRLLYATPTVERSMSRPKSARSISKPRPRVNVTGARRSRKPRGRR